MLKTFFNAANNETVFSLATCLAASTLDPNARYLTSPSHLASPPVLETIPCRLNKFCEVTKNHYGPASQVLRERTLFSLFCSCMPCDACNELEMSVCMSRTGCTRCPLAPRAARGTNRFGLFCPECERNSYDQTGRHCSLTIHCIPLLTRCPLHDCNLYLRDVISAAEIRHWRRTGSVRKENSRLLGEICLKALDSNQPGSATNSVRDELTRRGYFSTDGRLGAIKLGRDVSAALSGGFEDSRAEIWVHHFLSAPGSLCVLQRRHVVAHPTAIAILSTAIRKFDGGAK